LGEILPLIFHHFSVKMSLSYEPNHFFFESSNDQVAQTPEPDRSLVVTDAGRETIKRLHPGYCDPDLPFRINQWSVEGLLVSRPAIDRYIRTFFGRQMRYPSGKF
jgi:hypothetical protein